MIQRIARNRGQFIAAGVAILAVIVLAVAISFRAADRAEIDELTRSTNKALCTFKADLVRRADQTEDFIREHPEGIAGISVAELQRSLDSQRATVSALADLRCS